ncbi:hypothetical protein JW933_06530 [candidate division FCPU426 bacterium]|nr:hypothetical protein [candidate division FCPU426 bacterium]
MKKYCAVCVVCLLIGGCRPQADIAIDENTAIGMADAFLKAVMQGEYQKAYDEYMSPGLKFNPNSTPEQFTADWEAIVEKYGAVKKAVFDAYQIVPGKRVLQLYYLVTHAQVAAPVVYHLVLEQNQAGKFTIFIIDIGNEQKYPPGFAGEMEKKKKDQHLEVLPE